MASEEKESHDRLRKSSFAPVRTSFPDQRKVWKSRGVGGASDNLPRLIRIGLTDKYGGKSAQPP